MKVWLVFYEDVHGYGDPECCNVFYSWVVQAPSKQDAINKVAQTGEDPNELDAEEKIVI